MTEEEKREFEEFLQWKEAKKKYEEEKKREQEEAERQKELAEQQREAERRAKERVKDYCGSSACVWQGNSMGAAV